MSTATAPQKLTRKQRRAARHAAAGRIMPPEGVELTLPIAGVGVRLGAQVLDVLLTFFTAIVLVIFLASTGLITVWTWSAVATLLFFLIRVPYYVLTELMWNGQTLGKRLLKIKVVSHFGGPLTTHAIVLRNIMKEAEVFLPGTLLLTLGSGSGWTNLLSFAWIVMAFAIPLLNPHRRRLGDMLAGTHVVHLPVPSLLSDLSERPATAGQIAKSKFPFLAHQLDHYGSFELQTLETLLRAQNRIKGAEQHRRNTQTIAAIVEKVRKKIGYGDAVKQADHLAFLQAFYNAQRAHLEQRQLFGDRRSDKFHRERPKEDA